MENNQTDCLLCGASAELRYHSYPGYQAPDAFDIYHCPACDTGFSLPRVETSSLYQKIYDSGSKAPGYARYWLYAQCIQGTAQPLAYLAEEDIAYWAVQQTLPPATTSGHPTTILEIGSGLGYLTYALRAAGYEAVGLDLSQTAITQAKKTFGDHYINADLTQFSKLSADSFDAVIMTELIEHVEDPTDLLRNASKLLARGGRIIVTTPNKSLYSKDIIWASDLPPVHCWWFSEHSMHQIAESLNLQIQFLDFTPYHKQHYSAICNTTLRRRPLPRPYLSESGELLPPPTDGCKQSPKSRRSLITRWPALTRVYGNVRALLSEDFVVCRERGVTLCAIMRRD